MIKKTQEYMKNGGDINNPMEAAQKMGLGAGTPPNISPMMGGTPAMGSPGIGAGMMGPMGQWGMGMNPFMMNQNLQTQNQPNQPNQLNPQQAALQQQIEKQFFAQIYSRQLKELSDYGFKDEAKNLQALRETKGNIDEAMEKLCS